MSGLAQLSILMTTDTVGGVWTYSCGLATTLSEAGAEVSLVTLGPRARADQRAMLHESRVRLIETDLALEWQDPEGQNIADARRVLAGLVKRIDRTLSALSVGTPAEVDALVQVL